VQGLQVHWAQQAHACDGWLAVVDGVQQVCVEFWVMVISCNVAVCVSS
jgi:hypothetical protein